MSQVLQVLLVEDVEEDAALILRTLRRDADMPHCLRVDTRAALSAALSAQTWDIVISDYFLPAFNGLDTIELVHAMAPGTPVIIVSGTLGEGPAVAVMRAGAKDFFVKGKIECLPLAVARELADAQIRRQQQATEIASKALHLEVINANNCLRRLSSQVIQVQEKERQRLAHDLHDDIGQCLAALKITLDGVRKYAVLDLDTQATIDQSRDLVSGVIDRIRHLSLALRPPQLDDLGLAEALRFHVERQAVMAGMTSHFTNDPATPRAHPDIETTCFRITQEVISNIVKHARASSISCVLTAEAGGLRLTIRDDGCGFDVDEAVQRAVRGESAGMLNMRERASLVGGCVTIESGPSGGTLFELLLPETPAPLST